MGVPAVRLDQMNMTANQGVMESLIDLKAKICARVSDSEKKKTAVFRLGEMAIRDVVDSKEAGSVMITPMDMMVRKRSRQCEIGNGAVTNTVRTVSGTAAASLNRSLSGWTLPSQMSHGAYILSRTSNAGRRK